MSEEVSVWVPTMLRVRNDPWNSVACIQSIFRNPSRIEDLAVPVFDRIMLPIWEQLQEQINE